VERQMTNSKRQRKETLGIWNWTLGFFAERRVCLSMHGAGRSLVPRRHSKGGEKAHKRQQASCMDQRTPALFFAHSFDCTLQAADQSSAPFGIRTRPCWMDGRMEGWQWTTWELYLRNHVILPCWDERLSSDRSPLPKGDNACKAKLRLV